MNEALQTPTLNSAFLALSDPTRRAILARLSQGEATGMELAGPVEVTQPADWGHLKGIAGAGLITRRAEGPKRPCWLSKSGLEAVDQWLAMLRDALSNNYDRLDHLLVTMKSEK